MVALLWVLSTPAHWLPMWSVQQLWDLPRSRQPARPRLARCELLVTFKIYIYMDLTLAECWSSIYIRPTYLKRSETASFFICSSTWCMHLNYSTWEAARAKEVFGKHVESVLNKIAKLRSLIGDLQRNYPDDPTAKKFLISTGSTCVQTTSLIWGKVPISFLCSMPCLWIHSLQGLWPAQFRHQRPGRWLQQVVGACRQRWKGWTQWGVPKLQYSLIVMYDSQVMRRTQKDKVENCVEWSCVHQVVKASGFFDESLDLSVPQPHLQYHEQCDQVATGNCHQLFILFYSHVNRSFGRCTKVAQSEAKIRSATQQACPVLLQCIAIGPSGPGNS